MLKVSGKRALSFGFIAASALLWIVAEALAYTLPDIQFPHPTGKYPVGTESLLIKEGLPGQIWYPAASKTENAPYFREGESVIAEIAKLFGLPAFALSHFRWIETPAYLNAPIARNEPSYAG